MCNAYPRGAQQAQNGRWMNCTGDWYQYPECALLLVNKAGFSDSALRKFTPYTLLLCKGPLILDARQLGMTLLSLVPRPLPSRAR